MADWAESQKVADAARELSRKYPETYEALEFEPYSTVVYGRSVWASFRDGDVTFIRNVETGEYSPWTY